MVRSPGGRFSRFAPLPAVAAVLVTLILLVAPSPAAEAQATAGSTTTVPTAQQTSATPATPSAGTATGPSAPSAPTAPGSGSASDNSASVTLDLRNGASGDGAGPVQVILLVTLLAIGPAILMLVTSFTRIVIVLSLTRNAIGMQSVPPNQVMIGLAMFLTFFIMSPVLTQVNKDALQPYLDKQITQSEAFDRGVVPVKEFMTKQVRESDLSLFIEISGEEVPEDINDVPLTTLVPAFVIGELRAAFIIGFVIFIPFLVIDMVVSAALMSMGMVMVQPMTVALPFKLLLFVLVDGWQLLAGSLVESFVR
jgi:flagellar biosynthetic protein FliP